ncbi:MAG: glycosyl transferase [Oscillospiraceae bacterium]|nr:glycosyl transferase [Oscillospiraceae bacterium]
MSRWKTLKRILTDQDYRTVRLAKAGVYNRMPDEAYLKKVYRARMGRPLNLEDPQLFSEKLQWLKLYDRNPLYTQLVDKYKVREYIAEKLGEEYLIPLLGVWDDPDDIDFDALPDQFVLKCNHNSGTGMCICRDKSKLDHDVVKTELRKGLHENLYLRHREWPYKNVKPRIVAETYLEDTENDALIDYKFFCFHGVAKVMYISRDIGKEPRTDFFDMNFQHLPIRAKDPPADVPPQKPVCFDEMKRLAETLAKDIPHLRVDFYFVQGKVYVGELTFYHVGGFARITPDEWDFRMGSWIRLSRED